MSTTASPRETSPTAPVLARLWAGLIGLLAVAAALGVSHFVAALVSPSSSPFLAVGDTVIRFSPQALTEFAKTTFGTADKPVLLGGMAVVIALVTVAGGLASRRRETPGRVVIVVLGLLGAAAIVTGPTFAPLDLLAPAVAIVVGVVVFALLHRQAVAARTAAGPESGSAGGAGPGRGREAAEPPGSEGFSRRTVLVGSGAAVAAAAVAGGLGGSLLGTGTEASREMVTRRIGTAMRAPGIPAGVDFVPSTPTFLTPNPAFYRIDVALRVPQLRAEDWSMTIHGMVDREVTLRFDDLVDRGLVEKTITMTCVSNVVGGDLVSTANFVGVPLRDLLLEAGVRPGAQQLLSTSAEGGWTATTPVDVVMEPDRGALVAVGMNGEALPTEHGFPVRMVVPGLYGFVSATKWLTDIEVTTFDAEQAYWTQRGWAERAPIKTQSRIDTPRSLATVSPGTVSLAGIAWAQHTGIEKVEIRADGGPWRDAELATEVNYDTWRMWRTELDLGPGFHTVQSRATDRSGFTQPEGRVEPIPDGATGWHGVQFTVG